MSDPLLELEAPDGHPDYGHLGSQGLDQSAWHDPITRAILLAPEVEHAPPGHPGAYGGDTAPLTRDDHEPPVGSDEARRVLLAGQQYEGDDRPRPGLIVPTDPHVLAEMIVSEVEQLTRELIRNTAVSGISDVLLVSTDQPHATIEQPDTPVLGARRTVLTDRRSGGTFAVAAATPTALLTPNNGRVGCQVSNAGAGTATLYLATVAEVTAGVGGLPSIFLPVGGSWNGLLTKVLWVGSVTVVAGAGGTTLNVAAT